jgi:dipeptidyl-peptidase-3
MQARFSILRTFLNAGVEFCELEYNDKTQLSDLTIRLERSKILELGRPAVEDYLRKLHIYKSSADVERGRRLYEEITTVEPFYENYVRPAVLRKKTPRKVFVQANTVEKEGKVELREYEASVKGMVESYAEREYV